MEVGDEIRCFYCRKWFTKKRKNGNYCSPSCSDKACYQRYSKKVKGVLRRMAHYRRHKEKINKRRMDRYWAKKKYGERWMEFI